MPKILLIFLIAAVLIILVALGLRVISGEDDWICINNQWVKHGNPSFPAPTTGCGINNQPPTENQEIFVLSPQPNQTIINNPLIVEGTAKGSWFFEASFPIKILNNLGQTVATSHVQALSDWMTPDFVNFKGEITVPNNLTEGILLLENDNPSGLPENHKEFRVNLKFNLIEKTQVKVYFNNSKLDPEASCNKVFPVNREVIKVPAVARAALEELLKGPTEQEKSNGYFTSINPDVIIQKLTIENNIAKVDFNEQIEFQVGGSCRVSAIRAEITQTLKQFSTVKDVIISVNGRTEDILQP